MPQSHLEVTLNKRHKVGSTLTEGGQKYKVLKVTRIEFGGRSTYKTWLARMNPKRPIHARLPAGKKIRVNWVKQNRDGTVTVSVPIKQNPSYKRKTLGSSIRLLKKSFKRGHEKSYRTKLKAGDSYPGKNKIADLRRPKSKRRLL